MTNPIPSPDPRDVMGRCFLLLRYAALQLFEDEAAELDSMVRFSIASLHLQLLAFLTPGQVLPTIPAPTSVPDAIHQAAKESMWWDLAALPAQAIEAFLVLAELDQTLQQATPWPTSR